MLVPNFSLALGHKVFCGYLLLARTAACRKLPGKLLTEIGERYLFSTSDGSLEIKDFVGRFGNGIYLSDDIETRHV